MMIWLGKQRITGETHLLFMSSSISGIYSGKFTASPWFLSVKGMGAGKTFLPSPPSFLKLKNLLASLVHQSCRSARTVLWISGAGHLAEETSGLKLKRIYMNVGPEWIRTGWWDTAHRAQFAATVCRHAAEAPRHTCLHQDWLQGLSPLLLCKATPDDLLITVICLRSNIFKA